MQTLYLVLVGVLYRLNCSLNYPIGQLSDILLPPSPGQVPLISVADPGFPQGGGANSPEGANIRVCQNLTEAA